MSELTKQERIDEAVQELDKLADLLADSEEISVGQTVAVVRLNEIIDKLEGRNKCKRSR